MYYYGIDFKEWKIFKIFKMKLKYSTLKKVSSRHLKINSFKKYLKNWIQHTLTYLPTFCLQTSHFTKWRNITGEISNNLTRNSFRHWNFFSGKSKTNTRKLWKLKKEVFIDDFLCFKNLDIQKDSNTSSEKCLKILKLQTNKKKFSNSYEFI